MGTTLKLRHLAEEIADMCDAGDYDELCAYAMCSAIDARRMSMQCDRLSAEGRAAEKRAEKAEAERDAALAELKAERESATREEVWRLRTALDECRTARDVAMRERDEARSLAGMRDRALTAAVREREAFGLRLSAAERERDEARAALDLARESAREAREEIAQSLALVDDARAELDAALARPCVGHPTPEERAAHIDAGGEWLCCSTSEHSNTVADASYIPARDGLPCAWPVAGEVSP